MATHSLAVTKMLFEKCQTVTKSTKQAISELGI